MNEPRMDETAPAGLLPAGTKLRRRYVVGSPLERGAYGVTYEGYDERTRQDVAIKEYFPRALAERPAGSNAVSPKNRSCGEAFFLGSEAFLGQHRALMDAVGSPNVASVFDAFFENGTAYAVLERLEGATLEAYLAIKKRPLSAGEAMYVAASMADALLVVESLGILHHDVGGRSLFFCTDGTVKLTEFGAAKAALRRRRAADNAPPWTDLDALAKTLYAAMTGEDAQDGLTSDERVPAPLLSLFSRMVEPDAARRIASVFDYRHALACVEVEAICPDVSLEEVEERERARAVRRAALQAEQRKAAQQRKLAQTEAEPERRKAAQTGMEPERREFAQRKDEHAAREAARRERRMRRVALLCACGVLAVLIVALVVRNLLS